MVNLPEAPGQPEPKFRIGEAIEYNVEEEGTPDWVSSPVIVGRASGKIMGRRLELQRTRSFRWFYIWAYAVEETDSEPLVVVIDGLAGLLRQAGVDKIARMDLNAWLEERDQGEFPENRSGRR